MRDLLAQVPTTIATRAADLGCGPGNSTELLQARYPGAAVIGIDSSPDMIAAARRRLPAVQFQVDDIARWHEGARPVDVILANAVLQWLPDHKSLLPSLIGRLRPRGSLAVQMPDNLDEPCHLLMRRIAAEGPWATKLGAAANARAPGRDADWYYRCLSPHAGTIDLWRTTYHHRLADGIAGIVEWFRGTGLGPFLDPLNEAERTAFLDRYRAALSEAYPLLPDGSVLLPFPRLFLVATR